MLAFITTPLLLAYLFVTGTFIQEALVNLFHLEKGWRSKVVGGFLSFATLGFFSGIAVLFFQLSNIFIFSVFAVQFVLLYIFYLWSKTYDFSYLETKANPNELNISVKTPEKFCFNIDFLGVSVYLALAIYGFFLLFTSVSRLSLNSPWQTINGNFIYVFAAATFILGLLLARKLSVNILLPLLSVHTFLVAGYLPFTHELIYGADGWRHLAMEERIMSGLSILQPTITDISASLNLSFALGKISYSQLWGLSVILSKILGFSLLSVNKWLIPILWSSVVPILMFEIGKSFGWGKKISLLFVWLSFLPFTWQASSAFTLPVNYGFILWLCFSLLIFKRAEKPEPEQIYILLIAGLFSIFGYSLFAILFWVGFLLFELIHWKQDFTWVKVGMLILLVSAVLPMVEWWFGFSGFIPNSSVWDGLKQWFGNFMGYYLSFGPRPHDITTGNVIFNQVPSYAFVKNFFTQHTWWFLSFMIVFWGAVAYGLLQTLYRGFGTLPDLSDFASIRKRSLYCWFVAVSFGTYLSYIVSRYFLPGEHLLTRRLDPVLAFLFLILFVIGVSKIQILRHTKYFIIVGFLFVSFGISASFSLGPDTKTVSMDEYTAMNYIWENEKNSNKFCVIADVYPLLSLEALSKKAIVGGGFPIASDFEQPELSKIIQNKDVSILDVKRGLDLTGVDHCWIVIPNNIPISYFIAESSTNTNFGTIDVWRYNR